MSYTVERINPRTNSEGHIEAIEFDVKLDTGEVRPNVEFYAPVLEDEFTSEQLQEMCEAVVIAKNLAKPKGSPTVAPPPMTDDQKRTLWMSQIDDSVANVYNQFTRFQMEYEQREKAAQAYKDAGYTGDPTIWLTAFADSNGIGYETCADLVLSQASMLRAAVVRLGELRMNKYRIKNAETIEEADAAFTQIVTDINTLARGL